ncbi:MAG: hypothetical protein ACK4Q4_08475 [Rhodocyclaceae bacterium]
METLGVPIDFVLFAATSLLVVLFHRPVLQVALTGLAVITTYVVLSTGFKTEMGLAGFAAHMGHEWGLRVNFFCQLIGFALLARHFEDAGALVPKLPPAGRFFFLGAVVGKALLLARPLRKSAWSLVPAAVKGLRLDGTGLCRWLFRDAGAAGLASACTAQGRQVRYRASDDRPERAGRGWRSRLSRNVAIRRSPCCSGCCPCRPGRRVRARSARTCSGSPSS